MVLIYIDEVTLHTNTVWFAPAENGFKAKSAHHVGVFRGKSHALDSQFLKSCFLGEILEYLR